MKLLGVPPELIEQHTEVSYACAEAMAEGARRAFGSTVAYSTTGFAGPSGGTEKDPVGTVYIGISTSRETVSYRLSLPVVSTRDEIRNSAAAFVMDRLLSLISEEDAI
jgi:PncC family amidohydrolase